MFTKSCSKGLAATSFASLYLRTQPLLTFIKRSKCNLIVFRFFQNHLGKQNARPVSFFINFCYDQSYCAKRSTLFHSHSRVQAESNLTQTNNFTVKSVEDVLHSFDSLIACRSNRCLQNICNSTCWQLNYTAVTLSRLFKKTNWTQHHTPGNW